jgi:hypothetical protein
LGPGQEALRQNAVLAPADLSRPAPRPIVAPGANGAPANGNGDNPRVFISNEEVAGVAELLRRKGKSVSAGLKSVGSSACALYAMLRPEYETLLAKLERLPDK